MRNGLFIFMESSQSVSERKAAEIVIGIFVLTLQTSHRITRRHILEYRRLITTGKLSFPHAILKQLNFLHFQGSTKYSIF
jgi:hypothetical protein